MIYISSSVLTSSLSLCFLISSMLSDTFQLFPFFLKRGTHKQDNITTDLPDVLMWLDCTGLEYALMTCFFVRSPEGWVPKRVQLKRMSLLDSTNACRDVTTATSTLLQAGHCTRVPLWAYSWAAPIHVVVGSEIQHCFPYKYSSRLTSCLTTIVLVLHSVNHLFKYEGGGRNSCLKRRQCLLIPKVFEIGALRLL